MRKQVRSNIDESALRDYDSIAERDLPDSVRFAGLLELSDLSISEI